MQTVVVALLVANLIVTIRLLVLRKSATTPGGANLVNELRGELETTTRETRSLIHEGHQAVSLQLDRSAATMAESLREERRDLNERVDRFSLTLQATGADARKESAEARTALEVSLASSLSKMTEGLKEFRESNEKQLSGIAEKVERELTHVRESNEKKLDEMRETVDEKLHGTLEKRLGESFKQVSENLEAVHRGLGEMQQLALGVGDLKRVLTNVKSRGGWGEVQLGRQLEDILTREQYEQNVMVNPTSRAVVEYAIKLPGRDDASPVYLPIDAKFPQEDYDRLVNAQEAGQSELVEEAALQLERAVKLQAKTISDKYVCPPYTTDFAIMYLPTEGLFAEVIRRPGLCADLQRDARILITGPTTLMAILNSLQMGFRTLAIEKRTSEVWQILGTAKTEFGKYASAWEKIDKQLGTVQTSVNELGRRSRAVERSLRQVELSSPAVGGELPGLIGIDFGDEIIANDVDGEDSP
jgi:DNA recombination protein RmuC